MRELQLFRLPQVLEATTGVLCIEGFPRFLTLEDAWLNNERDLSCIPAGRYEFKRVLSPRFGDTFEVCNVPSRSHILLHCGNNVEDTRGCILIGLQFGVIRHRPCIWRSKEGFEQFLETMRGVDSGVLHIQSCTI